MEELRIERDFYLPLEEDYMTNVDPVMSKYRYDSAIPIFSENGEDLIAWKLKKL